MKKINDIIYELLRKEAARILTNRKGKCKIFKDKILCYVSKRKAKEKDSICPWRYRLIFHGIGGDYKKSIAKKYDLAKPIYYIIKNVKYDREINICASLLPDCHLVFEYCTFKEGIGIDQANTITFISNKYEASDGIRNNLVKKGEFYISTGRYKDDIHSISFIYDNINVSNGISVLWLIGQNVTLRNAKISNAKSIEIESDNLIIDSSHITSGEIIIDSENIIERRNSSIVSEIVTVENLVFEGLYNVESDSLFINGVQANSNVEFQNKKALELQRERLELISILKRLKSSCEDSISDKLLEVEEKIKTEPLKRVLRKKENGR